MPAFTVHHELGMQHQIATGLLHLCSVTDAKAQQPGMLPRYAALTRPNACDPHAVSSVGSLERGCPGGRLS